MFQDFIHFAVNSPIGLLGWIGIIVVVFMFWPRGRFWLISFIVLLFLAMWAINAIRGAVDQAQREASAQADSASTAISDNTPQWMKDLWQKLKDLMPSPQDVAVDQVCEYMGVKIACDAAKAAKKNLEQLSADVQLTTNICKDSPAVAAKFGTEGAVKFCEGNTFLNAQKVIDAIRNGAEQGATGMLSGLLVTDTTKLDTKPYLDCLYGNSTKNPDVNARSCTYTDPHVWRLCVEYHMQLPHEALDKPPAPLDPWIQSCRKTALGL